MIGPDFFIGNRRALSEVIGQGLCIIAAQAEMQRANDMAFKFEQDANFWWLTGISAPRWFLIMDGDKAHLVMPKVDASEELFNGSLSKKEAQAISGIDSVFTHDEYQQLLIELSDRFNQVYTLGDDPSAQWYDFTLNPASISLHETLTNAFKKVVDCRSVLKKLRAIKQPVEIEALQQAIDRTVEAFASVRESINSYGYEYEIEAFFNSEFRRTGLEGHAYDPIVAGGKNACTLHYHTNNHELPKDGLVLLDIGAKAHGYAADITRTYAVGTPSDRQRQIHAAVETAHFKIIDYIKPGLAPADYQKYVDEIMKDALQEVGLLDDRDDQATYRKYFPHAISHGLGLDVHESLGGYETMQVGMVLTVEPGIYIPEEGIGIRIEDDVLVTTDGAKNLSAHLPTSL